MLSVEQLYVNYGEKEILHDVDLQVAQEEIVMIVGESGSGKSTLVRSIMGLLGEEGHITKGNIVFQGVNLCQLKKKTIPGAERLPYCYGFSAAGEFF